MKSIFLLDGGFVSKKFTSTFKRYPAHTDIVKLVQSINKNFNNNESILRVYYYDCPPLDFELKTPIDRKPYSLKKTDRYNDSTQLLAGLKRTDLVAVREGFLSYDGWILKQQAYKKIKDGEKISDKDFKLNIKQKGADIKIGLDIAWISLEKIAERIILITGDSDFVPAMKFARRSGIQVVLFTLGHGVSQNLLDHTDILNQDSMETLA